MEKLTAPKTKPEFVERLKMWTTVPEEVLKNLNMEKLRLLYKENKPAKKSKILPANWKRFSKAALIELWVNQAMPFYELNPAEEMDHYHWGKDKLVVELERYVADAEEQGMHGVFGEEEEREVVPQCPECSVRMTLRTNRMSLEKFWGCPLYPECRKTFSLEYWGRPAANAQRMEVAKKTGVPKVTDKQVVLDGSEDMDGDFKRRAVKKALGSETSWELAGTDSAASSTLKLSPKEVQLIIESRKSDQ